MKVILNKEQIATTLNDLTERIAADIPPNMDVVVIGIRSRGEIIAQRLSRALETKIGKSIPSGTLDITLYRDDLDDPHGAEQPTVRSTEINFDISEKIILLVDDVLYTGRSVRAAMDALIDFGRPKAIRLAVLVDRGGHELPIQADYSGIKVDVKNQESVEVNLLETDDIDQVVVR